MPKQISNSMRFASTWRTLYNNCMIFIYRSSDIQLLLISLFRQQNIYSFTTNCSKLCFHIFRCIIISFYKVIPWL